MKFALRLSLAVLAAIFSASASFAETKRYLVSFESWAGEQDRARALRAVGAEAVEQVEGLDAAVVEVDEMRASAFSSDLFPQFAAIEEDVYWPNWLVDAAPSFYSTRLPGVREALLPLKADLEALQQPAPKQGPWADAAEFPWGIQRVNAQAAWPTTMGQGVRVAVIDTGIDGNHPDLRGQVVGGFNALDKNASWFDDNSHGSHVAGTIAGTLDNKGVVGVAPKAQLVAVKVLDKNGGGRLSSIVKGLIWCAHNDVQVANMSLGAPIGSVFMRLAVKYATRRGVAIVAAAGNSGGSIGYPAGFDESIAIAASDANDKIADFSSRGRKVEFIAPGVQVKSSLPGGGWGSYNGTSMATPHVAGLAALAVSRGARGTDAVRARLTRAARSIGLKPTEEGRGLIDAALVVK